MRSTHAMETIMQYALLFQQSPEEFAARTDPDKREQRDAFWAAFIPYMTALREAGVIVAGAGLEPPETATSIRLRDGHRRVQDGPFADSKEQLGGLIIIEVPTWTQRWTGRRAVRRRPGARSKSARSASDEAGAREPGMADALTVDRAARDSYGRLVDLPFRATRESRRRKMRSPTRLCRARGLAARWRAGPAGGVAADRGAAPADRRGAARPRACDAAPDSRIAVEQAESG